MFLLGKEKKVFSRANARSLKQRATNAPDQSEHTLHRYLKYQCQDLDILFTISNGAQNNGNYLMWELSWQN